MFRMLKCRSIKSDIQKIDKVSDIPHSTFSDSQKLFLITEQVLYSKYLLTIEPNHGASQIYDYDCKTAISKLKIKDIDCARYTNALSDLADMPKDYTMAAQWIALKGLLDHPAHGKGLRQIPKEFYNPFIFFLSGFKNAEESTEYAPILLKPVVYRYFNKVNFDFDVERLSAFSYELNKPTYQNKNIPILEFLSRYDWTGKNFGDVVNAVASLKIPTHSSHNDNSITSAVHAGLMLCGNTDKTSNYNTEISSFMMFVNQLSKIYDMRLTDIKRVHSFLSNFTVYSNDTLDYLIDKDATMAQLNSFKTKKELSFLEERINKSRYRYGKEASAEEEDDEVNADDEGDDAAKDDTDAAPDDNFGSDDMSMDGENPEEDSTSTDTSSTTDTAADTGEAVKESTVQPSDPTDVIFEVMRLDPSLETIIYRLKTEELLLRMIKNPPSNMSVSTLKAIKTWLTQWLFIVSPSVTNQYLTLKLSGVK